MIPYRVEETERHDGSQQWTEVVGICDHPDITAGGTTVRVQVNAHHGRGYERRLKRARSRVKTWMDVAVQAPTRNQIQNTLGRFLSVAEIMPHERLGDLKSEQRALAAKLAELNLVMCALYLRMIVPTTTLVDVTHYICDLEVAGLVRRRG